MPCIKKYIYVLPDPANILTKVTFCSFPPLAQARMKTSQTAQPLSTVFFSQGELNNVLTGLNLNSQGHKEIVSI